MADRMSSDEFQDAVVVRVLDGMSAGKTREALAKELGYQTYKSLDMHMRRKGFRWERWKAAHIPEKGDSAINWEPPVRPPDRVAVVLTKSAAGETDPKEVAKKLGFSDHREMATYMKSKGYSWSSQAGTYVKEAEEQDSSREQSEVEDAPDTTESGKIRHLSLVKPEGDWSPLARFLPLLEMLERSSDRLSQLLQTTDDKPQVPRYCIPGVYVTKSVHMSDRLSRMVTDFSQEKNISQKDIFEVALVGFFQKYGFQREVKALFTG